MLVCSPIARVQLPPLAHPFQVVGLPEVASVLRLGEPTALAGSFARVLTGQAGTEPLMIGVAVVRRKMPAAMPTPPAAGGIHGAAHAYGTRRAIASRETANVETGRKRTAVRCQCGQTPWLLQESQNHSPRCSLTMRAWPFGHDLRQQSGRRTENLTTPARPFLRSQKNS